MDTQFPERCGKSLLKGHKEHWDMCVQGKFEPASNKCDVCAIKTFANPKHHCTLSDQFVCCSIQGASGFNDNKGHVGIHFAQIVLCAQIRVPVSILLAAAEFVLGFMTIALLQRSSQRFSDPMHQVTATAVIGELLCN